jgi:putative SOS response-associated peptidase YedK
MCGRYRRTTSEEELARLYHIPIPKQTDLPISYNIVPSQKVLTIRLNTEAAIRDRHERRTPVHVCWAQIHPRMPVILPEQHHAAWLGETDDGNLKELLVPYPADQMRMWEISLRVNSPKNDTPSLWEPFHSEATQTTSDALEILRE